MRCAIFQININLIIYRNINFFTKGTFYHSFEEKLALSITNIFRNIHFLPHFHCFSLGFAISQINTDFLINQLSKYFYTSHLTLLLHSNKKFALSMAKVFWKIDFLPYFYLFSQWMRCAIFQINSDLLKTYEHNIFKQESL